jgi:protocatechuate 3,4-dioxygenase beta subunit
MTNPIESRITRRESVLRVGGLLAAALGADGWRWLAASEASAAPGCVLTPEQTEGPFYLERSKLRRNIIEGRPGVSLTLNLRVVDASTCKPIKGAVVDIWHCDADGVYSGAQQAVGRTFLRGIQRTNATGVTMFQTVYPGWYQGRTVHIHVKVHVGGDVAHTGQLYFPDKLTDVVYRRTPYNTRPGRSMRNADDGIFGSGGSRSLLTLRRKGSGYVGAITMGVRR